MRKYNHTVHIAIAVNAVITDDRRRSVMFFIPPLLLWALFVPATVYHAATPLLLDFTAGLLLLNLWLFGGAYWRLLWKN